MHHEQDYCGLLKLSTFYEVRCLNVMHQRTEHVDGAHANADCGAPSLLSHTMDMVLKLKYSTVI